LGAALLLGPMSGAAGADKAVSEPESPEQIVRWTKTSRVPIRLAK